MSEKGLWRLTVRSEFAASHSLRHYCGKCESLHGHNFGVEMTVEGDRLDPEIGILVDFKELKGALADVLERLDHKHLNEVAPFDRINPSSEHLARFLYQELKPWAAAKGLRLCGVTVSERAAQSATYSEA